MALKLLKFTNFSKLVLTTSCTRKKIRSNAAFDQHRLRQTQTLKHIRHLYILKLLDKIRYGIVSF